MKQDYFTEKDENTHKGRNTSFEIQDTFATNEQGEIT